MDSPEPRIRLTPLAMALLAVPLLLLGGVIGWFVHQSGGDRAETERVVREYILDHPEILPQAMENLQSREVAKRLAPMRAGLEKPFPGAVLGNPAGKVVLVEFSDFACTYCRQSVEDVDALIRDNPDLKVVIREFPILSDQSTVAARMGLAAALQGKYPAFHKAMYAAGRPDAASIAAAAKAAGVDLAQAGKAAGPVLDAELDRNLDMARQLGFNGTPSWVIGDEVLSGAVGKERLAEAIAKARG